MTHEFDVIYFCCKYCLMPLNVAMETGKPCPPVMEPVEPTDPLVRSRHVHERLPQQE